MLPYVKNIVAKNINEAFPIAVASLLVEGEHQSSRNGLVVKFRGPVVTSYANPLERVLFSRVRKANPFFHLYESLWMLAGRNELADLLPFNSRMAEYSDDGKLVRGSAYGVRWRHWFGHDQLDAAVEKLRTSPDSRRVVITQWDAATDNTIESKDVPCNTQCFVWLENGELNLTVVNRSNDVIYGCYGSNVVHFSILQEYIARRLGAKVGAYHQFSNNLHAYEENPVWKRVAEACERHELMDGCADPYPAPVVPLFSTPAEHPDFMRDLETYISYNTTELSLYRTHFFQGVAVPLLAAHKAFREKDDPNRRISARNIIEHHMVHCDWKVACLSWLEG